MTMYFLTVARNIAGELRDGPFEHRNFANLWGQGFSRAVMIAFLGAIWVLLGPLAAPIAFWALSYLLLKLFAAPFWSEYLAHRWFLTFSVLFYLVIYINGGWWPIASMWTLAAWCMHDLLLVTYDHVPRPVNKTLWGEFAS